MDISYIGTQAQWNIINISVGIIDQEIYEVQIPDYISIIVIKLNFF